MREQAAAVAERIVAGEAPSPELVTQVAAWDAPVRTELVHRLLSDSRGRRWLRGSLLAKLSPIAAATLARQLRSFSDDFAANRRDSTTTDVVRAVPFDDLTQDAPFWAGGNAAEAFWRRLSNERPEALPKIAQRVLNEGEPGARETMLALLLVDPYSEVRLAGAGRVAVLRSALGDLDDEVRGLAADVLAEEAPEQLATSLSRLTLDASERVRVAVWDAAMAVDFEEARQAALALLADDAASLDARRTALLALSAVLSTPEIAPLLEALVVHPERALAEVATDLLWTYHRSPSIAMAAAESPHESVRAAAARLLNPQTGSPAAGGSRPGAPERGHDIYQEMLKGYEREKDLSLAQRR
jgi:hypothetical protein